MFGLDPKSLIVGMLLGWLLLPMLFGMIGSKMGGKGAAAATA